MVIIECPGWACFSLKTSTTTKFVASGTETEAKYLLAQLT